MGLDVSHRGGRDHPAGRVVRPHQMYPGGGECPCPGSGSVYHHWFMEGRTVGLHDADRLARGIKAAVVVRLIAGATDQRYSPTEVSTLIHAVVDEEVARLTRSAEVPG